MRAGASHSSASLLAGDLLVVYGQQPPSRGKRQEQGGWRAPESGAGGQDGQPAPRKSLLPERAFWNPRPRLQAPQVRVS